MAEKLRGRGIVQVLAPKNHSEKLYAEHDEMIMILEGEGRIEGGSMNKELKKGDSVFIEKGSEYRMLNRSKEDFIYVRIMRGIKKEAR